MPHLYDSARRILIDARWWSIVLAGRVIDRARYRWLTRQIDPTKERDRAR